jgi:hypothetical protein
LARNGRFYAASGSNPALSETGKDSWEFWHFVEA